MVDFGSGAGHIVKQLDQEITQKVIMCDSSGASLRRSPSHSDQLFLQKRFSTEIKTKIRNTMVSLQILSIESVH